MSWSWRKWRASRGQRRIEEGVLLHGFLAARYFRSRSSALSVRQTLESSYGDHDPVYRDDGSWTYLYHQEGDGAADLERLYRCPWSAVVSAARAPAGLAKSSTSPRRFSLNSSQQSAMRRKRAWGKTAGEP